MICLVLYSLFPYIIYFVLSKCSIIELLIHSLVLNTERDIENRCFRKGKSGLQSSS